jgi:DNA-binding transcriptional ArsR family regulator
LLAGLSVNPGAEVNELARERRDRFDPEPIAAAFRALADETRLRILLMLEVRPRSVNEIVDLFTLTQPTISRHLLVLREAGLVNVQRDGQRKVYSLNESNLKRYGAAYFARFRCCSSKGGEHISG